MPAPPRRLPRKTKNRLSAGRFQNSSAAACRRPRLLPNERAILGWAGGRRCPCGLKPVALRLKLTAIKPRNLPLWPKPSVALCPNPGRLVIVQRSADAPRRKNVRPGPRVGDGTGPVTLPREMACAVRLPPTCAPTGAGRRRGGVEEWIPRHRLIKKIRLFPKAFRPWRRSN